MAEFEVLLQPYNTKTALAADQDGLGCIVLDLEHYYAPPNLAEELADGIESLFTYSPTEVKLATKLYVIGDLEPALDSVEADRAVVRLCELIEELTSLTELTWTSNLPFQEMVWDVLPKTLAKLIVNIGQPVAIDPDDCDRETYISQDAMKPLVNFTKLRELRVFGMRDSYQSLIWETVFRNEAEDQGMHVLDLQMAAPPLVRQEHWVKGAEVTGLSVSNEDSPAYRGLDGKGILHHNYGTGEYLDDYCMRKARIASGLDQAKPLPLWCLKLDGFVVDQLPFEHELSQVVLLTCGENCVDAGLRAPTTLRATTKNKWGPSVNNEATHCLIWWPNWAAIYDNEGRRLDPNGNISPGSDSDYIKMPSPLEVVSLTAEHLNMKDLSEAVSDLERHDSHSALKSPIDKSTDGHSSQTSLEAASVASTRGSAVPTPSVESTDGRVE